jgi:hypothetical protein
MRDQIEEGFMVFVADGEMGVAGVREVRDSGLVIHIQNAGDFEIPFSAVRDVHSKKVVLDLDRLAPEVCEALNHVHDSEYRRYATDPDAGTPDGVR